MRTISNEESVIDSRDIIERLDELESDLQDAYDDYKTKFEDKYDEYLDKNEPLDFYDWLESIGIDEYENVDPHYIEDYKAYVQEVKDNIIEFDEWFEQQGGLEFETWLEETGGIYEGMPEGDVEYTKDVYEEYKILKALADEGEQYNCDWRYGATLIRDSYFEDYCREFVDECGYIPKDFPDFISIDWEKTAENLKDDYTTIDFDGVEYYIQSM